MKTVNISGEDAAVEAACQMMLARGLTWLKAHPKHKLEGLRATTELQAFELAVRAGIEPSESMFAAVVAHLRYIQKHGNANWLDNAPRERVYELAERSDIVEAMARIDAALAAKPAPSKASRPSVDAGPLSPCGMAGRSKDPQPGARKVRVSPSTAKLHVVSADIKSSDASDASDASGIPENVLPTPPTAVKPDLTGNTVPCHVCQKPVPVRGHQHWVVCCSNRCRMKFLYGMSVADANAEIDRRRLKHGPVRPYIDHSKEQDR